MKHPDREACLNKWEIGSDLVNSTTESRRISWIPQEGAGHFYLQVVPGYVQSLQPEISSHLIPREKEERLICSQDPPVGCTAAEGKNPCPTGASAFLSATAAWTFRQETTATAPKPEPELQTFSLCCKQHSPLCPAVVCPCFGAAEKMASQVKMPPLMAAPWSQVVRLLVNTGIKESHPLHSLTCAWLLS